MQGVRLRRMVPPPSRPGGTVQHTRCCEIEPFDWLRINLRVKNDDQFIEKERSHTAPSEHLEKVH
jgi:hypothetical protein